MSGTLKVLSWGFRAIVALIFLQTLFFRFTGAEESKYIFTTLMGADYEAFGRIGSGIAELIAAILIVNDNGGTLFGLAMLIFILSLAVLFFHSRELPIIGDQF